MATPEEEVVVEEERQPRQVGGRQLALILGSVLVLILILWFLFLRGGGEEPVVTAPPTPPPATTPAPDAGDKDGEGKKKDGKRPVETFEVFAPKDPFDPLISEDAGGGEGGGGEDTGDGSEDTGDGEPDADTDGDGVPDTDGGGDATGDDRSAEVEGHRVELVATLEDGQAQIQVDETVYTVSEGERFARNFELISVSDECATLLYGDDQFTLCEGEEILK